MRAMHSMTGFGRGVAATDAWHATVEINSVNRILFVCGLIVIRPVYFFLPDFDPFQALKKTVDWTIRYNLTGCRVRPMCERNSN